MFTLARAAGVELTAADLIYSKRNEDKEKKAVITAKFRSNEKRSEFVKAAKKKTTFHYNVWVQRR